MRSLIVILAALLLAVPAQACTQDELVQDGLYQVVAVNDYSPLAVRAFPTRQSESCMQLNVGAKVYVKSWVRNWAYVYKFWANGDERILGYIDYTYIEPIK